MIVVEDMNRHTIIIPYNNRARRAEPCEKLITTSRFQVNVNATLLNPTCSDDVTCTDLWVRYDNFVYFMKLVRRLIGQYINQVPSKACFREQPGEIEFFRF